MLSRRHPDSDRLLTWSTKEAPPRHGQGDTSLHVSVHASSKCYTSLARPCVDTLQQFFKKPSTYYMVLHYIRFCGSSYSMFRSVTNHAQATCTTSNSPPQAFPSTKNPSHKSLPHPLFEHPLALTPQLLYPASASFFLSSFPRRASDYWFEGYHNKTQWEYKLAWTRLWRNSSSLISNQILCPTCPADYVKHSKKIHRWYL
jgi:hypothetical protein